MESLQSGPLKYRHSACKVANLRYRLYLLYLLYILTSIASKNFHMSCSGGQWSIDMYVWPPITQFDARLFQKWSTAVQNTKYGAWTMLSRDKSMRPAVNLVSIEFMPLWTVNWSIYKNAYCTQLHNMQQCHICRARTCNMPDQQTWVYTKKGKKSSCNWFQRRLERSN